MSVPACPDSGETSITALAVTVKLVETVTVPTVTEIWRAPMAAPGGTVMTLVKLPVVLVLVSPDFGDMVTPSNLKMIG